MLDKRKRGEASRVNQFNRLTPIEEISFDFNKRYAYLTGFHKRKLQRIKHAQDEATKQQREDKIQQRKELREERKREMEEHMKAVRRALENNSDAAEDDDSESSGRGKPSGLNNENCKIQIDHDDQYTDSETGEAIVTVESISVTRDGLQQERDNADAGFGSLRKGSDITTTANFRPQNVQKHKRSTSSRQETDSFKRKKKKFRYESVTERKHNRSQIRALKAKRRVKREGK